MKLVRLCPASVALKSRVTRGRDRKQCRPRNCWIEVDFDSMPVSITILIPIPIPGVARNRRALRSQETGVGCYEISGAVGIYR